MLIPTGDRAKSRVQSTVRVLLSLREVATHLDYVDGGDDLSKVLVAAFERYAVSNPLHPDVFPSVRKMEAEIVAMCLKMYNSLDGAGTMTSGGTESIVMAIKTHRDWARDVKGITKPEMSVFCTPPGIRLDDLCRIVPATAHAAFDKGAAYMGIKLHEIPVDPVTRKVNLSRVRRAMFVIHLPIVVLFLTHDLGSETAIPSW